jgi:hypothetical protein
MKTFWPVVWFAFLMVPESHGRGLSVREDLVQVANGQGIASPSYHGALFGQNPAGLVQNQRLKVQGGVAALDDSTTNLKASGAVLAGNGTLGAGVAYSQFDSGAYATGTGALHWGAAGTLQSLSTTLGISGRSVSGGASTYDLGLFFDFIPRIRIAAMAKDVSNGLHLVGAGLQFMVDSMVDFVIDADYQTQLKQGVVKPGFSLHTDRVQFTAAYGFRYVGSSDVFLYSRMTAGIGIRIADSILLQYQYRSLPQHLVGLTLRLN